MDAQRLTGLAAGVQKYDVLTSPAVAGRFIERYVETHLTRVLVDAVETEMGPIEQIVFE